MSRPGVAIIRSMRPPYLQLLPTSAGSRRSRCGVMLEPPMIVSIVKEPSGRPAVSFSAWLKICVPSSRALLRTSARTGSTPPGSAAASLRSRRSTVGMRNAKVLPVPVFALASTSEPPRTCGSTPVWMGVSSATPASARAITRASRTPGAVGRGGMRRTCQCAQRRTGRVVRQGSTRQVWMQRGGGIRRVCSVANSRGAGFLFSSRLSTRLGSCRRRRREDALHGDDVDDRVGPLHGVGHRPVGRRRLPAGVRGGLPRRPRQRVDRPKQPVHLARDGARWSEMRWSEMERDEMERDGAR
eukprot:scaffold70990_cov49-Phaeocystis_antarctica.AAC.4